MNKKTLTPANALSNLSNLIYNIKLQKKHYRRLNDYSLYLNKSATLISDEYVDMTELFSSFKTSNSFIISVGTVRINQNRINKKAHKML